MEDFFSSEDNYESKYATVTENTSINRILDEGYIQVKEDLSESIGSNLLIPPMGEAFSICGFEGNKVSVKALSVSPFVDKDKEITEGTMMSVVRAFSQVETEYLSMIGDLAIKAKENN